MCKRDELVKLRFFTIVHIILIILILVFFFNFLDIKECWLFDDLIAAACHLEEYPLEQECWHEYLKDLLEELKCTFANHKK